MLLRVREAVVVVANDKISNTIEALLCPVCVLEEELSACMYVELEV